MAEEGLGGCRREEAECNDSEQAPEDRAGQPYPDDDEDRRETESADDDG